MNISSFFKKHIKAPDDFKSSGPNKALIAGTTLAGAGIGALIGAERQARDVVTIEKVPYPETIRVQDGTRIQRGCHQFHYGYDAFEGEWGYHFGYDSSCRKTVPNYVTRETGRTLYKDVKHHTVGFPNTVFGGAVLGAGIGLVAGIAGSVAIQAISEN